MDSKNKEINLFSLISCVTCKSQWNRLHIKSTWLSSSHSYKRHDSKSDEQILSSSWNSSSRPQVTFDNLKTWQILFSLPPALLCIHTRIYDWLVATDRLSRHITEEALGGGDLSAGAGIGRRQPGYFLRQQSRVRGHLIDMYTERASMRAQLWERGLCDKPENSQAAVLFAIYLTTIWQKHFQTCKQLWFSFLK